MWISLAHRLEYQFSTPVVLGPHSLRLEPQLSLYGVRDVRSFQSVISPRPSFRSAVQDHESNWYERITFANKTSHLSISSGFRFQIYPGNPFDFVFDTSVIRNSGPTLAEGSIWRAARLPPVHELPHDPVGQLCWLNQWLFREVTYEKRMESGIQSPQQTLTRRTGSCRDVAWLLQHLAVELGFRARFVTGYLIECPLNWSRQQEGPCDPELHAWCEVFLEGAGWRGLDPSRGLLADGRYVVLSRSLRALDTAVVDGSHSECSEPVDFNFRISVRRSNLTNHKTKALPSSHRFRRVRRP